MEIRSEDPDIKIGTARKITIVACDPVTIAASIAGIPVLGTALAFTYKAVCDHNIVDGGVAAAMCGIFAFNAWVACGHARDMLEIERQWVRIERARELNSANAAKSTGRPSLG